MSNQSFSISVPNTGATIQGGAGPVSGLSLTTNANVFAHAGVEAIVESKADMRAATDGALGAAAAGGILIGTPATIQHSAGGGIQLYAGAGISPSTGSPSGPGAGFAASEAPQTGAGATADSLNAFNDTVKGVSDVAGAVLSYRSATDAIGRATAVFSGAKGAWDATKAATGYKSDAGDAMFMAGGLLSGVMTPANALANGDNVGATTGAIGWGVGLVTLVRGEQIKSNTSSAAASYGQALAAAQAAAAAKKEDGAPGSSIVPPADGPRIHEVAPANIDRECGADMTAKVGGNKDTKVDGNISTKSGGSITVKAFSAISTSSLTFSAHANVSASMKGLASAKVESLGSASLSGTAKVSVSSNGSGSVKAPKLTIEGTGTLTVKSAKIAIGAGPMTVDCETTINKKTTIKGMTFLKDKLEVTKKAELKDALKVGKKIQAGGDITTQGQFKNRSFKSG
jgi:hypothetical protein